MLISIRSARRRSTTIASCFGFGRTTATLVATTLAALTFGMLATASASADYSDLGQFGSIGTGPGQWGPQTSFLAVDPNTGDVYVATSAYDQVEKFDSAGNYVSQFGSSGTGNGQFAGANGVAVDPTTGDVYVSDDNGRVEKFDSNGNYLSQFGTYGGNGDVGGNGQFYDPQGVAVDPVTGDVYVVDWGGNRVEKFDSNGNYLSQFGSYGGGNGQFAGPYGVAVDPTTEDVYVTDQGNNRVQKFDSNGNYLSQFGSSGSGDGQFESPYGVAVDPNTGDLWVADWENNRVEEFGPSGNI